MTNPAINRRVSHIDLGCQIFHFKVVNLNNSPRNQNNSTSPHFGRLVDLQVLQSGHISFLINKTIQHDCQKIHTAFNTLFYFIGI